MECMVIRYFMIGESIPIRLFLGGYEMTPTMRDVNKKFSVRYLLNLVLVDEEDRRYFKQQVCVFCNILNLLKWRVLVFCWIFNFSWNDGEHIVIRYCSKKKLAT